jgi:hypothetical protein
MAEARRLFAMLFSKVHLEVSVAIYARVSINSRAPPRKGPVHGHGLIVSICHLAGEEVATEHVEMANGLRQAVEGIERDVVLFPEAEEPIDRVTCVGVSGFSSTSSPPLGCALSPLR